MYMKYVFSIQYTFRNRRKDIYNQVFFLFARTTPKIPFLVP